MRVVDTVADAYAPAVDRQGPCVPVDLDDEWRGREHADRVGEQVLMTLERLRQDLLEAAARVDRIDLAVDAAADVDRHVVPLGRRTTQSTASVGSEKRRALLRALREVVRRQRPGDLPTTGPIFAADGRERVEVEAVERGGVAAEHHLHLVGARPANAGGWPRARTGWLASLCG